MAYIDTALSNLNSRYQEIVDLIPDPYYYCDDYGNLKIVNVPDYDGYGYADYIYIENTGKVFFVGSSRLDDGEEEYSLVKRLNSDGSLDTSFSNIKFTGGNKFIRGIGKQSTGKYVVIGNFNTVDGNSANTICRLNADGTFDSSFSAGTGFDNNVLGCYVLSDDSIICFGAFNNYDGTTSARLCKLNSDGTINTAFTSNINVVNFNANIFAVEVLSSGKMYVGGDFTNRLMLLNADGSQDTSPDFGSGFNDRVASIKVQSDNKIMVGGWFSEYNGSPCNRGIVRLNTDATIDTSFANEGTGLNNTDGVVQVICIQPDGKYLVGGWFDEYNGQPQGRIIRFNSNGTKDISFNIGIGFDQRVQDIKMLSNGEILCAGFMRSYNNQTLNISEFQFSNTLGFGSARLSSTGTLLGTRFYPDVKYYGITDGGDDMYDDGNFIFTDLCQTYQDILDNGDDWELSMPITHTCALNETDNDDYINPPMDGVVVDSDAFFGAGSQYFTNMYPDLFVLIADNITVNEFTIAGGLGADGDGYVAVETVDLGGHTMFYKSVYDSGDPSVNHIIIVPGTAVGITHLYDEESEDDNDCIQGITGRKTVYYMNIARDENLQLSVEDATLIARKFLDIVGSNAVQTYEFDLTPGIPPNEGGEGSLDKSIVNGHSIQRDGYLSMVVNGKPKVVEVKDGGTFNNGIEAFAKNSGVIDSV
jgi:uncharacterized delta-60 repeat protein